MALASAVATLLAALFVCLGGAGTAQGGHAGHDSAVRTVTPVPGVSTVSPEPPAYVCPYDRGDCSLFPSPSPAVLSAPPLDPPQHAEDRLPRAGESAGDGPARRSGLRPRAPDLHVLQVLRT
ncbi:hypothetical protein [Streptomyces sp. NPDC058855]|uniref:hypothetical protein n=1 Tax=Streptomyces sp. NPDC058855 TaxID=3346651 RepID=UPI00368C9F10